MSNQEDIAKHYKRKQIESATPGQLIVLLYEGAIENLNKSEQALDETGPEKIEHFHKSLITAQDIITELMSSLDMEKGGEIAANLFRLYDFMHYRLIDANMSKEKKPIQEVKGLLTTLKDTWIKVVEQEAGSDHNLKGDSPGLNIQG